MKNKIRKESRNPLLLCLLQSTTLTHLLEIGYGKKQSVEAAWRWPEAETEARGGGRQPDGVSSAIREPGGASVGLLDLAKNGKSRVVGAFF